MAGLTNRSRSRGRGVRGGFQGGASRQIACDHHDGRLGPGLPDELDDLFEVMLHAAQGCLLKLALAVAEVVGGIVAKDAEMMLGQIVGEGRIVEAVCPYPGAMMMVGRFGSASWLRWSSVIAIA